MVAIAIPIFNSQLEKSRQATDLANLRAAYAQAAAAAIDGDVSSAPDDVTMLHEDTGFTKHTNAKIGSVAVQSNDTLKACKKGDTIKITVDASGTPLFNGK